MTKQERAEQERRLKEFPSAILNFQSPGGQGATHMLLMPGDKFQLTLEKQKATKWPQADTPGWEEISVDLREQIPALAELIRALVVRYNAIVKDANAHALATPRMEPLAIIDIEDPPEQVTA